MTLTSGSSRGCPLPQTSQRQYLHKSYLHLLRSSQWLLEGAQQLGRGWVGALSCLAVCRFWRPLPPAAAQRAACTHLGASPLPGSFLASTLLRAVLTAASRLPALIPLSLNPRDIYHLTVKWSLSISSLLVCPPHQNIWCSFVFFPNERPAHPRGHENTCERSDCVKPTLRSQRGLAVQVGPGQGTAVSPRRRTQRKRQPGSGTGERQAWPQRKEWEKNQSSLWTDISEHRP